MNIRKVPPTEGHSGLPSRARSQQRWASLQHRGPVRDNRKRQPEAVLTLRLEVPACPHSDLWTQAPDCPPVGHCAHASTGVPCWSCHCLAPAPAPECRPRAVSAWRAHNVAALPPTAPAAGSLRPPNRQESHGPVRLPHARRSRPGDTAGGDQSTWPPIYAPADPARPVHAQGDCLAPAPAQSCRSRCTPASTAPAGSP